MSRRRWDIYDTICTLVCVLVLGWGYVIFHFIVKWW